MADHDQAARSARAANRQDTDDSNKTTLADASHRMPGAFPLSDEQLCLHAIANRIKSILPEDWSARARSAHSQAYDRSTINSISCSVPKVKTHPAQHTVNCMFPVLPLLTPSPQSDRSLFLFVPPGYALPRSVDERIWLELLRTRDLVSALGFQNIKRDGRRAGNTRQSSLHECQRESLAEAMSRVLSAGVPSQTQLQMVSAVPSHRHNEPVDAATLIASVMIRVRRVTSFSPHGQTDQNFFAEHQTADQSLFEEAVYDYTLFKFLDQGLARHVRTLESLSPFVCEEGNTHLPLPAWWTDLWNRLWGAKTTLIQSTLSTLKMQDVTIPSSIESLDYYPHDPPVISLMRYIVRMERWKLHSSLQPDDECPICFERYDDAGHRRLVVDCPARHTFGLSCLASWALNFDFSEEADYFKCVVCRQQMASLPREALDGLYTPPYHHYQLDQSQQITSDAWEQLGVAVRVTPELLRTARNKFVESQGWAGPLGKYGLQALEALQEPAWVLEEPDALCDGWDYDFPFRYQRFIESAKVLDLQLTNGLEGLYPNTTITIEADPEPITLLLKELGPVFKAMACIDQKRLGRLFWLDRYSISGDAHGDSLYNETFRIRVHSQGSVVGRMSAHWQIWNQGEACRIALGMLEADFGSVEGLARSVVCFPAGVNVAPEPSLPTEISELRQGFEQLWKGIETHETLQLGNDEANKAFVEHFFSAFVFKQVLAYSDPAAAMFEVAYCLAHKGRPWDMEEDADDKEAEESFLRRLEWIDEAMQKGGWSMDPLAAQRGLRRAEPDEYFLYRRAASIFEWEIRHSAGAAQSIGTAYTEAWKRQNSLRINLDAAIKAMDTHAMRNIQMEMKRAAKTATPAGQAKHSTLHDAVRLLRKDPALAVPSLEMPRRLWRKTSHPNRYYRDLTTVERDSDKKQMTIRHPRVNVPDRTRLLDLANEQHVRVAGLHAPPAGHEERMVPPISLEVFEDVSSQSAEDPAQVHDIG